MLKRIKDINEALPGMLLIECIYLVVAQIIIFIAVPNKIMYAMGMLVGAYIIRFVPEVASWLIPGGVSSGTGSVAGSAAMGITSAAGAMAGGAAGSTMKGAGSAVKSLVK